MTKSAAHAVVFLMYHELEMPGRALAQSDPGYGRYTVRAADFQRQMESLRSEGWKGVTVGEAVGSFEERAVAITFDDGCETDLLFAAPVLRQMGFGATFYITSGWLGKQGHLGANQLREICTMGFEIGCHSMNHFYLTDLDDSGLHREIVEAKAHLEQIVGVPVEHLSCPGGRFARRVAEMAKTAGYRTVTTSRICANPPSGDRLSLGRVAVMRDTSLPQFREICHARGLVRMRMGVQVREAAMKVLGNSAYDRLRGAMLRTRARSV
jgi:peptidoglycan/xylan/chitin deacetylase (PgdA/CDA1 family)